MSYAKLMALPSCLLVSVGGRRSQRPGSSPTLGPLGPSHQRRHKSRVSLRGPPCAHGVSGTPHGEVRDRNIPGSSFKRTMSTLFYDPFLSKFVDYASPKFREIDIWLWIVEDRRAEQVFELARKLQS